MTIKLLGNESGTPLTSSCLDYFRLHRFQADLSGVVSQINIYVIGSGYVKVALYADSAGEPGARLAKQDTTTAVVAGWNLITLEAPCPVVSGTY